MFDVPDVNTIYASLFGLPLVNFAFLPSNENFSISVSEIICVLSKLVPKGSDVIIALGSMTLISFISSCRVKLLAVGTGIIPTDIAPR